MAKWKCGICGSNFENFHAQGFNNKIYCPLCYFKKENQELKKQLEEYKKDIKDLDNQNKRAFENMQLNQLKVCNMIKQQKEFIKYLEDKIKYFKDLEQFAIKVFNNKAVINLDLVKISIDEDRIVIENLEEVLQKYKEIIGDDK